MFWQHVSGKVKQPSVLSAAEHPVSGQVHTSDHGIVSCVESHVQKVFNATLLPQPPLPTEERVLHDHGYASHEIPSSISGPEHSYVADPHPYLSVGDGSSALGTDPRGWLEKDFSRKEVKNMLKTLKSGKAVGWDKIPNEALVNAPPVIIDLILLLFNMIKKSRKVPRGWKKGVITLVFKGGIREDLGCYRPITVWYLFVAYMLRCLMNA